MGRTLQFAVLGSAAAALAVACARPLPRAAAATPRVTAAAGPEAPRCAVVSGPALGELPLELEVGGRLVRVVEWTQGDEASSAVLGFAAQLPADVDYTVQAGGERFPGRGERWLHPRGLVGPRVHAIEAIEFCRRAPAQPVVARR